MRLGVLACGAAALALAACAADPDASDNPLSGEARQSEVAAGTVELRGDGIGIAGPLGTSLAYTAPRTTAESEIAKVLGDATGSSVNEECGAGPMAMTSYPGGLTLNFQDAKLVGWFYDGDGSGDPVPIQTKDGLTAGSTAAEVGEALTLEVFADSTLGDEFYSREGIGGFFETSPDGRVVSTLYAGSNCFFR